MSTASDYYFGRIIAPAGADEFSLLNFTDYAMTGQARFYERTPSKLA
jgi:hypothetical protein